MTPPPHGLDPSDPGFGGGLLRVEDPSRARAGRCELCRRSPAPPGDHFCVNCRARLTDGFVATLEATAVEHETPQPLTAVHDLTPRSRRGRMHVRRGD